MKIASIKRIIYEAILFDFKISMPTIKKISSPEDYSTSIDYLSNYSNYEEMFLDYS